MRRRINIINENQLTLPFGERRKVSISYEDRIRFFWTLVAVAIASLALYVYAINAMSRNIAAREQLARQVVESGSELSSLEFEYIALKNSVTIEKAAELGFREVKRPLYVSRNSANSLTLNTVKR